MSNARRLCLISAVVGLAALVLRVRIDMGVDEHLLSTLWRMARFFTILTNSLVVAVLSHAALTGRMPNASLSGAITAWILLVGIVHHVLLANDHQTFSADWWADQGLHTAVPALVTLWWLLFAPKVGIRLSAPARWLAWPVAYFVYVLVRGAADGRYPYFFFDVSRYGYLRVLENGVGLAVGFFLASHVLRLVGWLIARR
jgi:hypothetical protein